MSPIALLLLRRVATVSLLTAAGLFFGSRLLVDTGIVGPDTTQKVEQAAGMVAAARDYGATPDVPAFQKAASELANAEALLARGEDQQARQAAERAHDSAIVAQRVALMRRAEIETEAGKVTESIDRSLNELETLYGTVTKGLDKPTSARLLSLMKVARSNGAALLLSNEHGDHALVVAEAPRVEKLLEDTKQALKSAKPVIEVGQRPTPHYGR